MASADADEMVAFRLAPADRRAIERLIQAGEFRNRSDFLRYAVKSVLATHAAATAPKVDLDLDAVELPPQTPARAKPRGRNSKGVRL